MTLECNDGEFEIDGKLAGNRYEFDCRIAKVCQTKIMPSLLWFTKNHKN
jgi:hypothetical protein